MVVSGHHSILDVNDNGHLSTEVVLNHWAQEVMNGNSNHTSNQDEMTFIDHNGHRNISKGL